MNKEIPKDPIVNCHTHIFKGEHVPPYLAKSFVWPPMYYLFHLPTILAIFKYVLKRINRAKYRPNSLYNRTNRFLDKLKRIWITRILLFLILFWLSLNAIIIGIRWISIIFPISGSPEDYMDKAIQFLLNYRLLLPDTNWWLNLAIVIFVFSFVKIARNLFFFILRSIWRFLNFLPGKNTKELLGRYVLLGRYALYQNQTATFTKLKGQYPPGSRFVILPMDMKYMKAGNLKPEGKYKEQMAELVKMKNSRSGKLIDPFVFIDPRRIEKQKGFLDYSIHGGKVSLEKCEVQEYIEDHKFGGFKIYPALGYYPFDEALLPLWKYAADEKIPIMTHCIRGTIFYRGSKLRIWDTHPIFLESDGKGNTRPLSLPQKKNIDFSVNFTNPLNYLCLLSEPLLRRVVAKAKNPNIRMLFGFSDSGTPLKHDLSHLKICLAHFGGEEEWVKYLEADRYSFSQRLIKDRTRGIDFKIDSNTSLSWNVLEQIWKYVDWYSIICSMILQYPNVYSDISYILSKPRILPLLKETLDPDLNPHLRERVLFGTDFYVVRNHFSEKDLVAQMTAGLSEEEFDLIARENPKRYLR